jgi:hypothetical protein
VCQCSHDVKDFTTYDPILASPLSSCVTLLDGYVMLLPSNTLLLVSSNLLHSQVDEVT